MLQRSTPNQMTTFTDCLSLAKEEGYAIDFDIKEGKLTAPDSDKKFQPEDIQVENFYRFEGVSDPADSMILYLIRAHDGTKGTLSDGYGVYADEKKSEFMKKVEEMEKKS